MVKVKDRMCDCSDCHLLAVSPLDGRYQDDVKELAPFVSEFALFASRAEVEVKYLLALSEAGVARELALMKKRC